MYKQKAVIESEISGKLYQLHCDVDSPLGCLHDALMQMKGYVVDRMIAAQKEEEAASEKQKSMQEE